MKMEAETEGMQPQAKEGCPRAVEEGKPSDTLISDCWPPGQ